MLNREFEFTPEDLSMNKKGILTDQQKTADLRPVIKRGYSFLAILGILFTVATIYSTVEGSIVLGICVGAMSACVVLGYVIQIKRIIDERRDYVHKISRSSVRKLAKVQKSQIRKVAEHRIPLYQVAVGDIRINFDQEQYSQLSNDKLYSFYYWFYDSDKYNPEKLSYVLSVEEQSNEAVKLL